MRMYMLIVTVDGHTNTYRDVTPSEVLADNFFSDDQLSELFSLAVLEQMHLIDTVIVRTK